MKRLHQLASYSILGVLIFVVDRITKSYALEHFGQTSVAASWLSFDLTFNRGISWGMLHSDDGMFFWLVTAIIGIIALILLVYTFMQFKRGHPIIGETLVLAGAVSNILDRMLYGGVVDFIIITLFNVVPFGVFNIADVCIVAGVGLMVITGYRHL